LVVPAKPGTQVCVTVSTEDGDEQLGCKSFIVAFNPYGSLDETLRRPGGLLVRGWAIDPDSASPIDVQVQIDGATVASGRASLTRADLTNPDYGTAHGYEILAPTQGG